MKIKSEFVLAVCVAVVVGMTVFAASASAKKEKVGVLENGVFTDSRFGYSITMPTEWRDGGIRDEYSPERITFLYKRVRVPARLRDVPDEALRPIVMIFADSTPLTPAAMIDSLSNGITKDPFRDKILNKSIFFQRGAPTPAEIKRSQLTKVGGQNATLFEIRREYTVRIEQDRGAPELVRDFRTGWVYLIPRDGALIYLELVCENQFQNELQPEFDAFINSLSFAGAAAADSSATTEKAAGE